MQRRRCHFLVILAALIVAIGAAAYIGLDRWQRHTIFSVELGEARWAREPPPGTEMLDLPVGRGQTVRAWYLAAASPDAPTVLYLHGSRWNLNSSVFRMERWLDMGVSILAIDYRGFGQSSPGLPSEASATEDAEAGMQELGRRQPDPSRRFVYGHSLGGAIAVALSARKGVPDFAGLILESSFTNIREMIDTTRWRAIPGLRWLITQPFDSLDRIAAVRQPILLLHGTSDSVVPDAMSDALYEAAARRPNGMQTLAKIASASHSGASRSPEYADSVGRFMRDARQSYAAGR